MGRGNDVTKFPQQASGRSRNRSQVSGEPAQCSTHWASLPLCQCLLSALPRPAEATSALVGEPEAAQVEGCISQEAMAWPDCSEAGLWRSAARSGFVPQFPLLAQLAPVARQSRECPAEQGGEHPSAARGLYSGPDPARS